MKIGIEDGAIELNDKCYSFMEDKTLLNDSSIFIDNMTKYEYLQQESIIVMKKILSYFEII